MNFVEQTLGVIITLRLCIPLCFFARPLIYVEALLLWVKFICIMYMSVSAIDRLKQKISRRFCSFHSAQMGPLQCNATHPYIGLVIQSCNVSGWKFGRTNNWNPALPLQTGFLPVGVQLPRIDSWIRVLEAQALQNGWRIFEYAGDQYGCLAVPLETFRPFDLQVKSLLDLKCWSFLH